MRGCGLSRRRSRHHDTRCLRPRRAAGKWQQGDVACPLDGYAQPALVPCANAGHAPRENLPALLHELRQDVRALVVDEVHLLDAKLANLLLAEILALAPGPSAGTARTTATRSTFAPRTTVPAAWSAVTTTTFTPRSSAWRRCLFLFLCHTFHPFTDRPDRIGVKRFLKPEILRSMQKIFSPLGASSLPQPAPGLPPLWREPAWCGADAARRASRASARVFSDASNLHPAERSDT